MEVKDFRAFFEKRQHSMTRTFIVNLSIGLGVFLLLNGIVSVASAQETTEASTTESTSTDTTATEPDTVDTTSTTEAGDMNTATDSNGKATKPANENAAARQEERAETQAARQEERASTTEARQEERAAAQEERRAALSQKRADRILVLADNIDRKMNAAIDRMEQINDRFNERIAIMKDNGVDTAAAEAALATADEALTDARTKLATELPDLIDATIASEDPRANWGSARTAYNEVRTLLQSAHAAMVDALQALKQAAGTDETKPADETDADTATTTATTTSETE